jgi:hypothetical protein
MNASSLSYSIIPGMIDEPISSLMMTLEQINLDQLRREEFRQEQQRREEELRSLREQQRRREQIRRQSVQQAIPPSRDQITRLKKLEVAVVCTPYKNIINPSCTSCPIKCEDFGEEDNVVAIKHCSHIFDINEIKTWFLSHLTCPMCRYNLSSYRAEEENHVQLVNPSLITIDFFDI